jgi:hypothetical protein
MFGVGHQAMTPGTKATGMLPGRLILPLIRDRPQFVALGPTQEEVSLLSMQFFQPGSTRITAVEDMADCWAEGASALLQKFQTRSTRRH